MADDHACCVQGCKAAGRHQMLWMVAAEAWGEVEKVAWFCCAHYDAMLGRPWPQLPYVDLAIIGVEREA